MLLKADSAQAEAGICKRVSANPDPRGAKEFFVRWFGADVRLFRRPSAQREGGGAASAAPPAESRRLVSRQAHVL